MKKCCALLVGLSLVLLFASRLEAHSYKQGEISIGHVWTRATPGGVATAAVYFPLLNNGTVEDRLTGASSPAAAKIEIHQISNDNGIMSMKKLDFITLAPDQPVALRPNGIHLMVFGLKAPLREGDRFPFTLTFEKSGSISVEAVVEKIGAMSGDHE